MKTLLVVSLITLFLFAGVAFATEFSSEAQRYLDKVCSRKTVQGASAVLCDLAERVTTLEGTSGSTLRLEDADGQDLGTVIDEDAQTFVTFHPDLDVILNFANLSQPLAAKLRPVPAAILFPELDCVGAPFLDLDLKDQNDLPEGQSQLLQRLYSGSSDSPPNPGFPRYTIVPGQDPEQRSFLSKQRSGILCSNRATSSIPDDTLLLQEPSLPFTEPLAWPLQIVQ